MKKILTALLLGFSTTISAFASEIVEIVWPFNPGSPQAALVRHVIDEANSQQSKYRFVFASKPGAGGSVAAHTVQKNKNLSVLASTSAFYIRPLTYNNSHAIDEFVLINSLCLQSPMALFSKKYRSMDELKGKSVTVGIIPGTVTQLFVQILAKNNPEFNFVEIPYKGTPEAVTDVIGGHIDLAVSSLAVSAMSTLPNDVTVLGASGNRDVGSIKTFSKQGVTGLEHVISNYVLLIPSRVDPSIRSELNLIFNAAIGSKVAKQCADDNGVIEKINLDQARALHQQSTQIWTDLTKHIPKQ